MKEEFQMANISKLSINIQTASASGASTDGDVYIGLCGREFYLDTSANDFQSGSSRTYILGQGANVREAANNDPRSPQIREEDIDRFPVYVRFVGENRGDNWRLGGASITINDRSFPSYQLVPAFGGVWMGTRATGIFFIPKHVD